MKKFEQRKVWILYMKHFFNLFRICNLVFAKLFKQCKGIHCFGNTNIILTKTQNMQYFQLEEFQTLEYKDKKKIVESINKGGIFVFPTDSVYSIGCLMSNKSGIDKILKLTGKVEKKSSLSLFFTNLKSIADYTQNYNNSIFRSVKTLIPGPYTFIFNANKKVTKSFENSKKEVGIRIPDHSVLSEILNDLDEPIISTSLNTGDLQGHFNDPFKLSELYKNDIDVILDCGPTDGSVTTVLDCTGDDIQLIREGKGKLN